MSATPARLRLFRLCSTGAIGTRLCIIHPAAAMLIASLVFDVLPDKRAEFVSAVGEIRRVAALLARVPGLPARHRLRERQPVRDDVRMGWTDVPGALSLVRGIQHPRRHAHPAQRRARAVDRRTALATALAATETPQGVNRSRHRPPSSVHRGGCSRYTSPERVARDALREPVAAVVSPKKGEHALFHSRSPRCSPGREDLLGKPAVAGRLCSRRKGPAVVCRGGL